MEDRENLSGSFDSSYNKLISQEDFKQVSMSVARPGSSLNHHRVLANSLAVLAVLLLAVDIGLGVYYNRLAGGQHALTDISSEMSNLQASYNIAIQRRDVAKKQLATEISRQQLTMWELEHEIRRVKTYENNNGKIQMEIAVLKSHIPMIKEGCRRCLPGWTLMDSVCYYFPFSDTMVRRRWEEARQFCKNYGADLAMVNSKEKQLAISELINSYQGLSRPMSLSGFWIGLRDVDEEGTWRWLDGTRLTEWFWNDGEPNNQNNEDCAALYPRENPFKSWNDAPCNHGLKWICEMAPSF